MKMQDCVEPTFSSKQMTGNVTFGVPNSFLLYVEHAIFLGGGIRKKAYILFKEERAFTLAMNAMKNMKLRLEIVLLVLEYAMILNSSSYKFMEKYAAGPKVLENQFRLVHL